MPDNRKGILVRIVKVAAKKSARLGLYALAVGSLAILLPEGVLDPTLFAIASSLGIEAFGILLDRVISSPDISNAALLKAIQTTLDENHFAEMLTEPEFKHTLNCLFEQQRRFVEEVIKNSGFAISELLLEQLEQHDLLNRDLRTGLYTIHRQIEQQEINQKQRHEQVMAQLQAQVPDLFQSTPLFGSPPLPREFVGRETVIPRLLEIIEQSDKAIIHVGGLRGIGKTYLAARLYQEIDKSDKFHPLWVDCHSRSVTLELLLDALIEISHNPELAQTIRDPLVGLPERIDYVIEKFMEQERVIIFIDDYHILENLVQRDRLDDLIMRIATHGQQTKIVAIGHERPSILDHPKLRGSFREFFVEGLVLKHTKKYLTIPNLTNEQVRKIWMKCGRGNPLAMTLFSLAARRKPLSVLLELPIWDIDNTAAQWLDPILNDLNRDEMSCLNVSSLLVSSIPVEVLDYVCTEIDVYAALGGLQDKGLFDHKPGSARWQIRHDIIREYVVSKKLSASVKSELERALATYYAGFVLDNSRNYLKLYAESPNILEAMAWVRRRRHSAFMTTTAVIQALLGITEFDAIQLVLIVGELADRSGNIEWAVDLYNEVTDWARSNDHLDILARVLKQLADLARWAGNYQLAIARFEESIRIGRQVGGATQSTIAQSCYTLGQLLMIEGRNRYAVAEEYLLEGLQTAKVCNDDETRAKLVGQLVYLYRDQGEFTKFYNLYQSERHALHGIPLAILLIGTAPRLIEIERFEEALGCILEARVLFENQNNLGGEAYTWRLLAHLHRKRDELDSVEENLRHEEELRRLAVSERTEEAVYLLEALWEQHCFYTQTNQLTKAEISRTKCAELVPELAWRIPQMLTQEAELLLIRKSYRKASQRCREAMGIYEEQNNLGGMAWTRRIQGDILAAQGQLAGAFQIYKEGLEFRSQLLEDEPGKLADDLEHLAEFSLRQLQDIRQAQKYFKKAKQEYQLVDSKKAYSIEKRLLSLELKRSSECL